MPLPDVIHLGLNEFCCPMQLARPLPSLCHHVGRVFGIGAKKQMIRIHAASPVVSVQAQFARRNFPVVQFPGNPMDINKTTFGNRQAAIAFWMYCAMPIPAFILRALGNIFPEPFSKANHPTLTCH